MYAFDVLVITNVFLAVLVFIAVPGLSLVLEIELSSVAESRGCL